MINQNSVIDDIRIASRNRYSCIYGSLYMTMNYSILMLPKRLFAAEESNEFFETNHRKHSSIFRSVKPFLPLFASTLDARLCSSPLFTHFSRSFSIVWPSCLGIKPALLHPSISDQRKGVMCATDRGFHTFPKCKLPSEIGMNVFKHCDSHQFVGLR